MQLLTQQQNAIARLQHLKVGALFMEPGTGKTRAAYELVKSVEQVDYILWLTPFQTKGNLQAEINKCGGLPNLEIIGIETLSSSDRVYLDLYNKLENCNAFLVVDESLKIKNWEAIRTKRIIELGKKCEYKLILNGTPVTRNLLDLWAQMEFLSPKILNMGTAEYKNTFCEWTKVTKRIGHRSYSKEFITKYHNVDYLYSIIKPYVYECDLDLAVGKQYHDFDYTIEDAILEEYKYLKEKYLDDENLAYKNNNIFLELTQKMQHLYCCSEEKFDIVKNLIKANGVDKIIIYCKYIASREAVTRRFPDATVLSYGMHSFGLNLQDKNIIIYFDKTFDYAQRTQSEHRIWRTGQKNNCIYYDLSGNVGLEKLINDNISKKISLADYFKNKAVKEIKEVL